MCEFGWRRCPPSVPTALQNPEVAEVGRSVIAPDGPEHRHRLALLSGGQVSEPEMQPRVVGSLQAAPLDGLLHRRDALVELAVAYIFGADREQRVAVPGSGLGGLRRKAWLVVRQRFDDQILQPLRTRRVGTGPQNACCVARVQD